MRPPSVPSEATCAVHPGVLAAVICARCGSFACSSCARSVSGQWYCSQCTGGEQVRAGLGERFLANLIDHLLVILPAAVVAGVVFVMAGASGAFNESGSDEKAGLVVIAGMGLASLVFLGALAAQIWAQVSWGQSLGKRLMSIKVVRTSGAEVELWRLLLIRNLAPVAISQLCGIFGLVDALFIFGAEQRCLHDQMCDTIVVHHPRAP